MKCRSNVEGTSSVNYSLANCRGLFEDVSLAGPAGIAGKEDHVFVMRHAVEGRVRIEQPVSGDLCGIGAGFVHRPGRREHFDLQFGIKVEGVTLGRCDVVRSVFLCDLTDAVVVQRQPPRGVTGIHKSGHRV